MDKDQASNVHSQPENLTALPPARYNQTEAEPTKPPTWQERLLPLMGGMLVSLAAFFFLVTFLQMSYLHWSIFRSPPIQMESANSEAVFVSSTNFADLYEARQFEVRAAMERYIIEKRYHQISVLLMSGLWLRYLGFITGMILALVGASFILGKLREPEQALEGKFSQVASLSLRTTSPGIILAVLGVVLMFTTLVDKDVYDVKDANVYLSVLAPLSEQGLESGEPLQRLPDLFEAEEPAGTNQLPATPDRSTSEGETPTLEQLPATGGDP